MKKPPPNFKAGKKGFGSNRAPAFGSNKFTKGGKAGPSGRKTSPVRRGNA